MRFALQLNLAFPQHNLALALDHFRQHALLLVRSALGFALQRHDVALHLPQTPANFLLADHHVGEKRRFRSFITRRRRVDPLRVRARAFHREIQLFDLLLLPRQVLGEARSAPRRDRDLRFQPSGLLRDVGVLVDQSDEFRLMPDPRALELFDRLLLRLRLLGEVLDVRLHRTEIGIPARARRSLIQLAVQTRHLHALSRNLIFAPRDLRLVRLDGSRLFPRLLFQRRGGFRQIVDDGSAVQRFYSYPSNLVLHVRRARFFSLDEASNLARALDDASRVLLRRALFGEIGEHLLVQAADVALGGGDGFIRDARGIRQRALFLFRPVQRRVRLFLRHH